jgi:dienelactone hydrolase
VIGSSRLAALLLCLSVQGALAGVVETRTTIPAKFGDAELALEAIVVRPTVGERFPLALVVHGAAPHKEPEFSLENNRQWAIDLAERGYLAVAFARRGHGRSEGAPFRFIGNCERPAVGGYFAHHAEDVAAVLRVLRARPDVDASKTLLIGKSVGGMLALDLAARAVPPVSAVINVSGGVRIGEPKTPSCAGVDEKLVDEVGRFGRAAAGVPTLWVYAANDAWFPPEIARRMFDAYTAGGGRATLNLLPPSGTDGHAMFQSFEGKRRLWPVIDAFLRDNRLPTWTDDVVRRLAAALPRPCQGLIGTYVGEIPFHKAMAVGTTDGRMRCFWAGKAKATSESEAAANALDYCAKSTGSTCTLVAIDLEPYRP